MAWGDSFASYDPDDREEDRRFPFATVVVSNYPGFDEESQLDREGVFRLNVAVGRERFTELIGYPPSRHGSHAADWDYAAQDVLLPHPTYGQQAWVSIVNPGERTADLARELVTQAYERARARLSHPSAQG